MAEHISAVLELGAPEPDEMAAIMQDKLRFHTDAWDLSVDLKAAVTDIVVMDARPHAAYIGGHIPGAVSFPHREMNTETVASLDRAKVYVVYCDGIGCNASTKGAYKLARLGFRAKELLGGLDWWRRDGHPVIASREAGSLHAAAE
ncbi:rhodanese-like domain-containing protein [Rhodopila sp.]|uniref:rhodanese-like domain-containing protein n=1 Tax=Rhodopila sp. TaxID=2480087 RepID=UPI003D0D2C61